VSRRKSCPRASESSGVQGVAVGFFFAFQVVALRAGFDEVMLQGRKPTQKEKVCAF
jgi:hypothetical protein